MQSGVLRMLNDDATVFEVPYPARLQTESDERDDCQSGSDELEVVCEASIQVMMETGEQCLTESEDADTSSSDSFQHL